MKTKIIITVVATLLLMATALKLKSNKHTAEENVYRADPEKRSLVQVEIAQQKDFDLSFTYTGTFAASREVSLVPQVHGLITAVYFNEGDRVPEGKRLVQVDDDLLQAQYTSVAANYENAKRNLDRYNQASGSGGVSGIQLDNISMNLKNAESQLKQLEKQIRLSKIQAPFTGTITFRDAEVGSMAANAPVARITDLTQLKLEISVPEKEIRFFKEGESIAVSTDLYPDKVFAGTVSYVADRADDAHSYPVKIMIRNNDTSAMLKAGMYGTASLTKGLQHETLQIPRAALLGSAKNPQVFVVRDNAVILKNIQTGRSNGESVEVIAGLETGEIVVTSGHINLVNGSKVEISE